MNSQKTFTIFTRLFNRSCVLEKNPISLKSLKIEENVPIPVEEDTKKLAEYVCGTNLFIEGGEDVKLKPDSEYPEWLWNIKSPPPLNELDQNTKTYWNRIRKIKQKENMSLRRYQKSKTLQK